MRFHVTPHAAERFVERVRPTLSVGAAQIELERLLNAFGELVEWERRPDTSATECWELAPGIWVPCHRNRKGQIVAVTVLTVDSMPEDIRARRNARRARKVAKRNRRTSVERRQLGQRDEWAA